MMFSRLVSFSLVVLTFGMLVSAFPIEGNSVKVRETTGDIIARGGGWGSHPPCNCGKDIIDILVDLKANIDVETRLLDGRNSPYGPANNIIGLINVAVGVLATVVINTPIAAVDVTVIVNLLLAIIISVGNGLGLYVLLSLSLWINIDICLSGLVKAILVLVPGVLSLVGGLLVNLNIGVAVHLALTILALGL